MKVSRAQRIVALSLGSLSLLLGGSALVVQIWRWNRGEASFVSSSVTLVSALMFCSLGAAAIVAGVRGGGSDRADGADALADRS